MAANIGITYRNTETAAQSDSAVKRDPDRYLLRSTTILVLCHAAGLAGLLSPWKELFMLITPFNLLLSTILLFSHDSQPDRKLVVFISVVTMAGYFVEVAGIATSHVFGSYIYGKTLGFSFLGVPPVMGINWLMLIYSAGIITSRLKANAIVKAACGAAMLVLLDLFIEPVAVRFDFWSWYKEPVPLQNYLAWFIIAFLLLLVFNKFFATRKNNFANALYIVQLVFFILLNIF